jgi:hypothetical protein
LLLLKDGRQNEGSSALSTRASKGGYVVEPEAIARPVSFSIIAGRRS